VGILQLSPHSAEKLSQSQMKQHPEHTLLAAWPDAEGGGLHAVVASAAVELCLCEAVLAYSGYLR
jgi:hypothetical protein